ncbi:increased loss of mitochondrial DNA protein 1 [Phyllosticta capitalensis]
MAVFSAFNLIRGMSLFHMTLAYYMLSAPRAIADQNLVFLLGEAMRIIFTPSPSTIIPLTPLSPHLQSEPTAFAKPSSATAFAAIFLALLGVSDLLAVSMDEEIAFPYWANQIPTRLLFLFGLTSYSYFFKPGLSFAPSPGDFLKNRVVFAWGFFECTMWFWAYIRIREEKFEFAKRLIERRRKEASVLRDE